jgi:hypothetical protein
MPALTKAELKKEIKKNNDDDTWEDCYGPTPIANSLVHEIWVTDQYRQLATRFIIESAGNILYFQTFETLGAHLDGLFKQPSWSEKEAAYKLKRFSLYVAASVFVLFACVLAYLVAAKGDTSGALLTAFVGVIASGGTAFFGVWVTKSKVTDN